MLQNGAKTGQVQNTSGPKPTPKSGLWFWGIGAVAVFWYVFFTPSNAVDSPPKSLPIVAQAGTGTVLSIAAPPEPLIEERVLELATSHAGKALGAEGAAGALVYSVNCWASLERTFALATVERCAAFDALTSSQPGTALPEVAEWFAEGAVATRYRQSLQDRSLGIPDTSSRLERLRVATAVRKVTPIYLKKSALPVPDATTKEVDEAASEVDNAITIE